ncbi:MAG: hypothetical protein HBSAPP03_13470 [Phycisphaerae bacterium]|nr:MAG: hypothetical protein HBSAPP03_13470 [Phycisphaerae bacterium]
MRGWAMITVLLAIALPSRAQPESLDAEAKHEVVSALSDVLARHAYAAGVDFSKVGNHLRKHLDALEEAEGSMAFARALNGALEEFGVSHVAVIPPEVARNVTRPVTIGIGAETRPAQGGLRVLGMDADSPAKAAGLAPGDVITHVDGKKAAAPEDLEGPSGSIAVLRVRKVSGSTVEARIERVITEHREPATYKELTSRTVMIHLPTFNTGYDPAEVAELLERAFWYPNLVIDLRGNGGGRVTNLLHLLSYLVPEGTGIGTVVTNVSAVRYAEATGGDPLDAHAVARWSDDTMRVPANPLGPYPGRLAVLIDGGSASASEVTAGALRETRGAKVIGQKSAGALLVSRYLPLPHDFLVQIPFSDYITVKGHRPEGQGILPDVEAGPARRGQDPAAGAAVAALEGV